MVRPIPILIYFLHLAIRTTSATCFRKDGTVDSSATVCDSTPGAASVCCDSGSSCQSNGVCQKATSDPDPLHGSYSVDSCTDSTWTSPVCLGQCSSGGQQPLLTPCNNFKDLSSAKWCCGSGNSACCGGSNSLVLPVGGSHQLPVASSQASSPSSTPQANPASSPQVSSVTVPPATVTFTPPPSTNTAVPFSSTPVNSPSSTPSPSSSPSQTPDSSQLTDPGPTAAPSDSTTGSSDISLSSTHSSSEVSLQIPVATTINSILLTTLLSNSLPTSSSSPPPPAGKVARKGLSAGLKVGIAIVAILLGLLLLGTTFWWIRKCQISKATASASEAMGVEERDGWPGPHPLASPGSDMSLEKSELHSNPSPWAVPMMNLLKIGRAELPGTSKVRMSRLGEKQRVELQGNEITASQLKEIQKWQEERDRQESKIMAEIVELDGTSRAARSSLIISPALIEDSGRTSTTARDSMIISPALDEGSDGGRLFMELANNHGVEKFRWG